MLADEDGYTAKYTTQVLGTESAYIFNSTLFNLFGLKPFGVERFGSNEDFSGKKRFRVYLGKDYRAVPLYNVQLEFASDGENQAWDVTGYGFLVRQAPVPEKPSLFHSFK
jgi:hypothetical protein